MVAREAGTSDHAAGEARQEKLHRHIARGLGLNMAAVRFHQRERRGDTRRVQIARHFAHEAADDVFDEGVGDGGGRALVFAPDRAHPMGKRNRQIGKMPREIGADRFLVRGVHIGEQQIDRDRPVRIRRGGDPTLDERGEARKFVLSGCYQHIALVIEALADAEDVAAQHA